ncbi:MAG: nuclear transport factor 2 family protein [Ectothiorhodospiraceae bacterium]|nr:nuclear transport factor 2 family protein [Ectothiorhodospiraceae bacterium]MCH8505479.1 nuclear transport factor 2 family protein [Ectothiorhodospiraceae bacterium]
MEPKDIVEQYLRAIAQRDYGEARRFLADTGFSYISPIGHFHSADDLMAHSFLSDGIVQRMEFRKHFTDGEDVCHILRFHVQISEKFAADVVHWATVRGGRIHRIEMIFDAYPYRILFSEQGPG